VRALARSFREAVLAEQGSAFAFVADFDDRAEVDAVLQRLVPSLNFETASGIDIFA
jgi:hypothetical protein